MFQVAAISVATEPVPRIRAANLRDPTSNAQTPPEGADSTSESVFEDPAAVVHIGAQARALARRDSSSERPSQRPAQSTGANGNGPLAEAARTAAQARASSSVEGDKAEEESSSGIENPLAEAASSAAKALWGNEEEDQGGATNAAYEAGDSSPDLVRSAPNGDDDIELSAAEKRKLDEMQQRDREIRQQEQSQATSAQFTGPVRYEYRMGPDGKLYAVDGSAPIDVRPVEGDPVATLRKMEAVERAARQGSEPSTADQQVAAEAARLAQRARAELAASRYNESRDVVDVRREDGAREVEQRRDVQRTDEVQSGVAARGAALAGSVTGETRETTEPLADVLSSAARSVEGTFSDAASAANVSEAPVDLALLNPGTTPPALRRYEEQQRPSGFPGGGFQLVA
jgi:hypothetical protein